MLIGLLIGLLACLSALVNWKVMSSRDKLKFWRKLQGLAVWTRITSHVFLLLRGSPFLLYSYNQCANVSRKAAFKEQLYFGCKMKEVPGNLFVSPLLHLP